MINKIIFFAVWLVLPVLGQNKQDSIFFRYLDKNHLGVYVYRLAEIIKSDSAKFPLAEAGAIYLGELRTRLDTISSLNRLGNKIILTIHKSDIVFDEENKEIVFTGFRGKLPLIQKCNLNFIGSLFEVGFLALLVGIIFGSLKFFGVSGLMIFIFSDFCVSLVGVSSVVSEGVFPPPLTVLLFQFAYALVVSTIGFAIIKLWKWWRSKKKKK
jgi:hypothetical protein